jgi:hypothetical protein
MMQLSRALSALSVFALAAVIACGDSGTLEPTVPQKTLGTTGQTDTGKSPPPVTNPTAPKPDSAKPTPPTNPSPGQPGPDTVGNAKPSTDPRLVVGTVIGMGPPSDSANYQKVAGATVVWTSSDGKELARAMTAADGTFSLGSFKPAVYTLTVTPPANGPYKGVQWALPIGEYSPAKVELTVWLGRK